MKRIVTLLLALILAFAMAFCAVAEENEIVVGSIFNVTGDQSSLDAPSQQGFALAIKLINENGGINGRAIRYVTYDGQTDQTVCANNATKLIQNDGALVIAGFSDSDFAYAAGAVAQAAGVPAVFTGATTPDIPDVVGDCAFMTAFGDNVCAYAAASFAYEQLGATTAYVLTDNSMSYTTNLSDYFIEKFEELGGSIVLQDYFSSGDLDFSSQAQRYLAGGEAGVLIGHPQGGTVIPAIAAAIGRRVQLVAPVGLEKRVELPIARLAALSNAPDAEGPRMCPLPGRTYCELDAIRTLTGAQAQLLAAGGALGAEGCVYLAATGTEEQIAAVRALAKELRGEAATEL